MGNCLCFKRGQSNSVQKVSDEENKVMGNECFKQGNFKDAIEFYTKAIKQNPTVSIYFSNRALCYYKIKDFQSAFMDGNSSYKLDPENLKALVMCIKAKASLALQGDIINFEHALDYCKHFKTQSKVQLNEEYKKYCKDLKERIKLLFNSIQIKDKKNKLSVYYKGKVPDKVYEKIKQYMESKKPTLDSLMCPLTIEIFNEPTAISSGYTYEKSMINSLIASDNLVDPLTRKSFKRDVIYQNSAVKKAVEYYSLLYPDVVFMNDNREISI